MPLFHSFRRNSYENVRDTIQDKAQQDINKPTSDKEDDTKKDLNRCGDLYFQTQNGEILTCPYNNQKDEQNGEKRLNWLVEQIQTHHKGTEEEKEAVIAHIKEHAHQQGFLFAGRNGVANMMLAEKDVTLTGENDYYSSAFSLRDNQLSYIERYDLPNGFFKNDEIYSSSVSLATVTTRSIMEYNANNESNPITQNIANIDITIRDKLALNLFDNRTSTQSKVLKEEKNLKDFLPTSDKPGFFKRLANHISDKFSSLFHRDEPSQKPKP